jgi:hypothetical protein
MRRLALALCALIAVCAVAAIALAATPAGDETQVNVEFTDGQQDDAQVAMDADGDFTVAWQSDGDGADTPDDIYIRRFGTPSFGESLAHVDTVGDQDDPSIASDPNGNGVVAFHTDFLDPQDVRQEDIRAHRFDTGGPLDESDIDVDVRPGVRAANPAVAMDADGNFVVAWQAHDAAQTFEIFAHRFNASGAPVGQRIQVTDETAVQREVAVAMDADGDFVVAWEGPSAPDPDTGVFAQRYGADGTPAGNRLLANTTVTGFQENAAVDMDADGDFVIAWDGPGAGEPNDGVFVQRFDAAGNALGSETLVNTTTDGFQRSPSVTLDADGDFAVSWDREGDGDADGVFTRDFTAAGAPLAVETRVNETTADEQQVSWVSSDADGAFVVSWETDFAAEPDTEDVFVRRFARSQAPPAAPTLTDTDPDSPANENAPRVKGSAEAGSTVRLYTDAACSGPVAATGAAAEFASPGLQVTVADNTTTTFYAAATDQAGSTSPCSTSSITYVENSAAPDQAAPLATIVSAPSGTVSDRTPTFTFTANEAGASFECSLDGGAFVPCSSPFTTPSLGGGPHTFAVRARDAAGNLGPVTTVAFSVARTLDELTAGDPPTLGQDVNVAPVGDGPVLVGSRTGTARVGASQNELRGVRFVPLEEARQIPVGSFLDTTRGTVELLSARNRGGATQSGRFVRGIFQVLQSRARRARGLTELRLKGSSFSRCGRAGSSSGNWWQRAAEAAQGSRRTIRRVRSNANGNFRTRGRHSAATVRGTVWEVSDRCDGTLTRVSRGSVVVRDFRRRRTIVVRAGKRTKGVGGGRGSYLAPAR